MNPLSQTSNWCYCSYYSLSFPLLFIPFHLSSKFSNLLLPVYFKFPLKNTRYIQTLSSQHKTLHSQPSCLGSQTPRQTSRMQTNFFLVTMEEVSKASSSSQPLDLNLSASTRTFFFRLSLFFCDVSFCLEWIILMSLQAHSSILNQTFPQAHLFHLLAISQLSFMTKLL